jgi:ATP synthase protein I
MAGEDQKGALRSEVLTAVGRYSGHGLTLALSTLLFLLGGWWLDGKTGTTPLFLILGAFVGAGAGFYSLYYHMVVQPSEREEEDRARSEDVEP